MTRRIAAILLFCLALLVGCAHNTGPTPTAPPAPVTAGSQTPATPTEEIVEPLYTRLSEERIEALAPRDDYGALYPFAGELSYGANGSTEYTYGLFDARGRIVCDPVYYKIGCLAPQAELSDVDRIPMLGLMRGKPGDSRCAVASLNGSFVSPEYNYVKPFSFGVVCAEGEQSDIFTVYDFWGTVLFTEESRFDGGLRIARANCFSSSADSRFLVWLMDEESGRERVYLLSNAGEVFAGGWAEAEFVGRDAVKFRYAEDEPWGLIAIIADTTPEPGCFDVVNISLRCETVLEPLYSDIRLCGSGWYAENESGAYIFDFFGELLMEVPEGAHYARWGYVYEGKYYLTNGSVIELGTDFYTPIDAGEDCTVVVLVEENGVKIKNLFTGSERFVEGLGFADVYGVNTKDYAAKSGIRLIRWREGDVPVLTDWYLEREYEFPVLAPDSSFYSVMDGFTGEEFICATNIGGGEDLYWLDGSLFAVGGSWNSIWNGLRAVTDERWCFYAEPMGEVVFRYPIVINGD